MATGINTDPMFADTDSIAYRDARVHTTTTANSDVATPTPVNYLDISNVKPLSLKLSVIDNGHQRVRLLHGKDQFTLDEMDCVGTLLSFGKSCIDTSMAVDHVLMRVFIFFVMSFKGGERHPRLHTQRALQPTSQFSSY